MTIIQRSIEPALQYSPPSNQSYESLTPAPASLGYPLVSVVSLSHGDVESTSHCIDMRSLATICRTAAVVRPRVFSSFQRSPLTRSLNYSRIWSSAPARSHVVRHHGQVGQQGRLYSCACSGKPRKRTVYVALGSNLGDRVAEIEKACRMMDERGLRVKRTSSLWETKAMYVEDQNHFINGACEVRFPCLH